jgi:hypothetical protein
MKAVRPGVSPGNGTPVREVAPIIVDVSIIAQTLASQPSTVI